MHEEETGLSVPTSSAPACSTQLESQTASDHNNSPDLQVFSSNSTELSPEIDDDTELKYCQRSEVGEWIECSPTEPSIGSTPDQGLLVSESTYDTSSLDGGGGTVEAAAAYGQPALGGTASADLPDTKEGIEELCPVCGDKVSGYHYGLLTCESCKGFFKRTVQNKKVYTCVADRSCHIDKTQRKRCPFCRFQKCLEVGMKLEAVRADRMRGGRNKFGPMYKRDRARKLQMMRQRQMAVHTLRAGSASSQYAATAASLAAPTSAPTPALTLTYQTPAAFGQLHIKQEIQIPQVSSLTSSPDSSPSPMAVALGQAAVGGGGGTLGSATTAGGGGQPLPLGAAPAGASTASGPDNSNSNSNSNLNSNTAKLWSSAASKGGSASSAAFHHLDPSTNAAPNSCKLSPMIRDFVQAVDDREWQNSLYNLLHNQTFNQCEVDLFELMCKVLDQNLFSQVDWARNSVFFKDLKVDDQMKLLQHSWSDMLVLDHMHQRMHNQLPDETALPNGQKFDLLSLGLLGVPALQEPFHLITTKLQQLKFDVSDYICCKFLLLLNPEVRGLMNKKHVSEGHEQVQQALLEYCVTFYPQVQDKFNKLLAVMPEIHNLANRGEDHLYVRHCSGGAPTQTLLMEMLHAKRK
ncbi:nuclear hormone receptor FTZ-F1-like [Nilaparvata lugens]|uniref:Nuclear hormone receptor FTZ-F1 n=2 Tax=Nilaparvata lugens TaxID=108931 RepID=A0A1L7H738_NILLU|nr:nuclear hormone receptor FTZ-F1-like [Nilaparvata lugens]APU50621.1 FTZ-F1 [Nilaparvata lugens]